MKFSQWLLFINGETDNHVINGYCVARDNAIRISYAHDNTRVAIVNNETGEITASYFGGLKMEG